MEQEQRQRWYRRALRRLHDRSDAIFILGFLALMGAFAYWMHTDLFFMPR